MSQGDSILIVNRDPVELEKAIRKAGHRSSLPSDEMDHLPFAVEKEVPLLGTVKRALLIDGGDSSYGDDVVVMMRRLGVVDEPGFYKDLYMMVSHFHADHQAGLHGVLATKQPSQKKGKRPGYLLRYVPGKIFVNPLYEKATVPKNKLFPAFMEIITKISDLSRGASRTQVVTVLPGGLDPSVTFRRPLTISLGDGATDRNGHRIPIDIRMVASGQRVYHPAKKDLDDVPPKGKNKNAVDMNDRSLCFMLTYGSFRFFSGGDIAGDGKDVGGNFLLNAMSDRPTSKKNSKKKKNKKIGSSHGDVETVLGPALEAAFPATPTEKRKPGFDRFPFNGHATVMKASHHASASSVDVHFLTTIRPYVVAISCGFKARAHDHPTQQVLNRLHRTATAEWGVRGTTAKVPNSVEGLYLTEVVKKRKGRTYDTHVGDGRLVGDIVIRPTDDSIVSVRASASGLPRVKVQVYGTGDQTDTSDSGNELFDSAGDTRGPYPIGPYEHPRS
ncbi:hypothetical protein [Herbidospora mongoliensis]|uniref:hypothetical protein n=1 Tax=Herbidospora mongoliensis TaxID=688067 RepID=UPI00083605EA|nr:hypothetical protein [Herbidospora mongoliensis]